MSNRGASETAALVELAPLLRRALDLAPTGVVRVRVRPDATTAMIALPFGILVGRSIRVESGALLDGTYRTDELLGWLDAGARPLEPPDDRGSEWRQAVPPDAGWRRIETVPDDVVRGLVRQGALTLKEAADRDGVPGAQPRAEVADALLDSVVLTVTSDVDRAEVSLRQLSALVRMGFLARDSHIAVDVAPRWTRLAASYGSAYSERAGLELGVLRPLPNPHRRVGG